MRQQMYLWQLGWWLWLGGVDGVRDYVADYRELIADRLAAGEEEAAILDSLGKPKQVAQGIIAEDGSKRGGLSGKWLALVLLLVVLGLPLWGGLALGAGGVAFALVLVILAFFFVGWLLPFTFGLLTVTALAVGLYGVPTGLVATGLVNPAYGLYETGVGLLLCSGGLLLAGLTALLTEALARLTGAVFRARWGAGISRWFFKLPFWLVVLALLLVGGGLLLAAYWLNGNALPTPPLHRDWYSWLSA